ncbi:MAG: PKD domain-containing protein, partial [Bacteroidota bacterium]
VTLTVTDDKGLSTTATKTITVEEMVVENMAPTASFTASPIEGIVPLPVSFNAAASVDTDGTIASYTYDFGDGNSGNGVTANNTYTAAGSYTVTLTVTDDDGATATATQTITVNEPGLADCIESAVAEQALTEISGLSFGGVSAAVINSGGELITAVDGNATPALPMDDTQVLGAADFTQTIMAALTLALMEEEKLMLSSTVGDFIDAAALTNVPAGISIQQLLAHTSGLDDFASDDDYLSTVLFDVTKAFTAAEITAQFVGPAGTPGSFAYSNTNFLVLGEVLEAANGEETLQASLDRLINTVAGTSLSLYDGADPSNLAPLFADVFGTGFPQQLTPNTSVFTAAGAAGNLLATPSDILKVVQALAKAEIISATNFARLLAFSPSTDRIGTAYGHGLEQFQIDINGQTLDFIGHTGSINYGSVVLYSLDAEAGATVITNNGIATEPDIFELAIKLLECSIDDVAVNQPPVAVLTATPETGEAPLLVNFDATASSDADGSIVSFLLEFGDGNTASTNTAEYTYETPGTYNVVLTVTDDKGATASATKTITVTEPTGGTAFSLQVLHASDLEGGVSAIPNAPNFAAIVDGLEDDSDNTLILSGGDNYIPGPFFNAAGNRNLRSVIQDVLMDFYNEPGLTNLREDAGRIDISIMNIIGFDASAVGNHEFDAGPDAYGNIIGTDIRGATLGDVRWLGANFPYLSANLDFDGESALAGLYTDQVLPNRAFQSLPDNLTAAGNAPKLAPATTVVRGGETIGIIGATTQILEQITSNGGVSVVGPGQNDMSQLAGIIQPQIDAFEAQGINKIILVTHLQQVALEKELATLLSGVDVIVAGGSDVLMAQNDDVLRPGDAASEAYPFVTSNADGDPAVVLGTPGQYTYVGRLLVDFDENGVIITESLDNVLNGSYATLPAVVDDVTGPGAFDENTKGELVKRLTDAVNTIVTEQDANIVAKWCRRDCSRWFGCPHGAE